MRFRLDGLWRHRDFRLLWTGQTISVFGSLTTRIALPFTAVIFLDARGWQVALITAADVIAGIAVGLFAGVWADRLRRRPIMIATDLGRAVVVGSIPLAAVFGVLRIEQLYLVAFAAGALTVFFDVAYQSYLPSLVRQDELIEGNSKLAASASVSEAMAFGSAGWLTQVLTAPGAIVIDAVTFLVSAFSIARIRAPEPAPVRSEHEDVRAEIVEGLRAVAHDPILRPLAGSWVGLSISNGMFSGIVVLFITRELGFSPGVQGMIYAVGGVSSLFGALLADRCRRRFGLGGAMILGLTIGSASSLFVALAPDITAVAAVLLVAAQLVGDPWVTVYDINQVSARQAVAPERLMGRVNAAVRFAGLVAMLGGALIAAALVGVIGGRGVLLCGAAASMAGGLALILSPVRTMRDVPVRDDVVSMTA